ncbi:hypothetical protein Q9L58_010000, partial [Maublancomyces gigas]
AELQALGETPELKSILEKIVHARNVQAGGAGFSTEGVAAWRAFIHANQPIFVGEINDVVARTLNSDKSLQVAVQYIENWQSALVNFRYFTNGMR